MRVAFAARANSFVRGASVALIAAGAAGPFCRPAHAAPMQGSAGPNQGADPVAEVVKQLARHVYFKRVVLQRADAGEGFYLWVQAPSPADPKVATAARTYGPWIARLLEVFAERVEQPLGLVRPQAPAVVLLDSAGDYRNYVVSGATRNAPTSWSAWDPRAGLGVSHLGSFESGVPPYEKRGRVLRAVSLALLESHSERRSSTQIAPWLREGLADYLSLHYAAEVESLGSPVVHREYLRTAIELTTDGALREQHWFSLETLAGLASTRHIADAAAARRRALGLPESEDFGRTYGAFFAQAHLWTHFLLDGDGGVTRRPSDASGRGR